jgi:FMN phosphatase YigB (HAD superfamily)
MGILGLADAVACGDDAGKGKPHPDLYAVALRKLGMKDASTCMAVGDSPYDDYGSTNGRTTCGGGADGRMLARGAQA